MKWCIKLEEIDMGGPAEAGKLRTRDYRKPFLVPEKV
jgi:hypothetical protein